MVAQVDKNKDAEKNGAASTLQDILQLQEIDVFCKQAAVTVAKADVEYTVDMNKLIVRVAPIGGAV